MAAKTVQLKLTDHKMEVLAGALVEEMERTCKLVRDELQEHLGGSNIGLANAREYLRTLNELANMMDQIDAPGWRETLPYRGLQAVS
jgi:hypothetical protein